MGKLVYPDLFDFLDYRARAIFFFYGHTQRLLRFFSQGKMKYILFLSVSYMYILYLPTEGP